MRIKMAYGHDGKWINLPWDEKITIIEPEFTPGEINERAAIRNALNAPIGKPPLQKLVIPDDHVAVVFSDLTRPIPNDRVLPPLLEELELVGVPDNNIVLINALGTHRPQNETELQSMLGETIVNRYKILQHNAWNNDNLVVVSHNHLAKPVSVNRAYVEANVRILTGFIEPHLFAGFINFLDPFTFFFMTAK